jgi:Ca2+-binding EF-hand superfamily protein
MERIMRQLLAGVILSISLMILAAADAGGQGDKKGDKLNSEEIFKKLDTNNDGKLSKEEYLKILNAMPEEKREKARPFMEKAYEKVTMGSGAMTLDQFKKLREFAQNLKKKNN